MCNNNNCIDAARVITDSKLVVQLQKSDEDQVKCQHDERLTNPCLMSAELAVVRTALTCYSGKKSAQFYCLEAQSSCLKFNSVTDW